MIAEILQRKISLGSKITLVHVGVLIIVAIAVYSNSLYNGFVWDDLGLVERNSNIRSWDNITKIMKVPFGVSGTELLPSSKFIFYRPLQIISYVLDYSLWGLKAGGYHITNIIFHALAAVSIYFFVTILYNDRRLSFLTSLLFVVNPLNVETVDYISGRGDSMMLFFMLFCFVFYVKLLEGGKKYCYIIMLLSYALALLSKESALVLIPALLAYHYIFQKDIKAAPLISLSAAAFVYLAARISLIDCPSFYSAGLDIAFIIKRIPGFFAAIINYIGLLFFPFNLHMDYGQPLFSFKDPKVISGVVVAASLLIYAFKRRRDDKVFAFAVCWFFLTLLPVSNVFYLLPFYMAEHYLYVPALGFFLILGRQLIRLCDLKTGPVLGKIFIASLLVSYASITMYQTGFWLNSITLYKQTLKCNPNSMFAHNNIGHEYISSGKFALGMDYLRKGLAINPRSGGIYYSMGVGYLKMKQPLKAIRCFKRSIDMDRTSLRAYAMLASSYLLVDKDKEAVELCKTMLNFDPGYAPAHERLAIAYFLQKKYDLADIHCTRAVELGRAVDPYFLKQIQSIKTRSGK